jgi:alpha-1,2-mannosyltransferase
MRGLSTPARWPIILAGLSLGACVAVLVLSHPVMIDLLVYRGEGAAVRSGTDLYASLYGHSAATSTATAHATYPPFAALLFDPLTYIAVAPLRAATDVVNLALIVVVAILSCRLAGIDARRRVTAVCVLIAAAPWSEPVFTTLRLGQINLLLLALVLWDFTRPASSRARGIGVGLAAAIKVTPAVFVVYLLLTRRFRAAGTAIATFVLTLAISGLVLPHATRQFWTKTLFDTDRVGRVENATNQSLRGLVARIDHARSTVPGGTLLVAVVAVAGLACAVMAYRHLGDRWGLPACAITGLLVSPISWSHHWVWCLPVAVLLWEDARRWFPAIVVFWSYAVWALPHRNGAELHFSPWEMALSGWYILFGLGFLALTGARIRAARRPGSPASELRRRPGRSCSGLRRSRPQRA